MECIGRYCRWTTNSLERECQSSTEIYSTRGRVTPGERSTLPDVLIGDNLMNRRYKFLKVLDHVHLNYREKTC